MKNLKVLKLDSEMELLNQNELYFFKGGLAGGQSDVHDIPEVIIPTPGGDHGGDDGGGYDDGGDPPTWDDTDPPYDDGDDPFPPDGGGDDNPSPPVPTNLPGTLPAMCQQAQFSGSCAIRALDWVGKYLGVAGLNKDDFSEFMGVGSALEAAAVFELGPGTSQSQYYAAVNAFFTSDHISSWGQAETHLGQGHPILATMTMPGGGLHAVVITGVDLTTGMITMANSLATGGFETVAINSINFVGVNAITGTQNNSVVTKYTNDTGDWWTSCNL